MITLRHAIKIAARREDAFRALTDLNAMTAWHLGPIGGEIRLGGVFHQDPKPALHFSWRTDAIEANTMIRQTCVDGPGASVSKALCFTLSDSDDGRVSVSLTHGAWAEDDPHLPFCNTHWGHVLHRLKAHLEQGAGA